MAPDRNRVNDLPLGYAFLIALLIEGMLLVGVLAWIGQERQPPQTQARQAPFEVALVTLPASPPAVKAPPVAAPPKPKPEQTPLPPPGHTVTPEPAPKPVQKAPPKREPKPKTEPKPKPTLKPKPTPKPKPEPRPTPKPKPAPRSNPEPRAVPEPEPRPIRKAPSPPVPKAVPEPAPAPSPSREEATRVTADFKSAVRAAVQRAVRYPRAARMMGMTGAAEVAFDYRDGRISNIRVVRSSGTDVLDHAATAAVEDAAFPPPPDAVRGAVLHFSVQIRFNAG